MSNSVSSPLPPFRDAAVALRALLSVRSDRRYRGDEDHEGEGSGLRRLQRARRRHQRTEATSGLPLLQQTHGRNKAAVFAVSSHTLSDGHFSLSLSDTLTVFSHVFICDQTTLSWFLCTLKVTYYAKSKTSVPSV